MTTIKVEFSTDEYMGLLKALSIAIGATDERFNSYIFAKILIKISDIYEGTLDEDKA